MEIKNGPNQPHDRSGGPVRPNPLIPGKPMRSLDFSLALLQQLVEDFEKNMERAVEESYTITLKPWHGWISKAAYKVALKLVPDTRSLITILMAKDKNCDILKKEMQALISLLEPALQEIHNLLEIYGLDRLKSI
nr:glycolipid transfer protein 3 [Ipomoea batatas]